MYDQQSQTSSTHQQAFTYKFKKTLRLNRDLPPSKELPPKRDVWVSLCHWRGTEIILRVWISYQSGCLVVEAVFLLPLMSLKYLWDGLFNRNELDFRFVLRPNKYVGMKSGLRIDWGWLHSFCNALKFSVCTPGWPFRSWSERLPALFFQYEHPDALHLFMSIEEYSIFVSLVLEVQQSHRLIGTAPWIELSIPQTRYLHLEDSSTHQHPLLWQKSVLIVRRRRCCCCCCCC